MCNEGNLDLFLSLKQKIVVIEHNELADVSLPIDPTSHLRVGHCQENMCVEDIPRFKIFQTLILDYLCNQ